MKAACPRYAKALACTCASHSSHIPLLWNSGQHLCIPHLHPSSLSILLSQGFLRINAQPWKEEGERSLFFTHLSIWALAWVSPNWVNSSNVSGQRCLALIKGTPAQRHFSYLKSGAQSLNSCLWDTYRSPVNSFGAGTYAPVLALSAKLALKGHVGK